jgi:Fe2+ transport system protein FeoA
VTAPLPADDSTVTLAALRPGQRGRLLRLECAPAVARRLMEMGFVPGTTVRLVRTAPLGDPIEVEVGAVHLTLRRAEAGTIHVEPF